MRLILFFALSVLAPLTAFPVQAAVLTVVSDVIDKSAPSAAANNTIKFTATSAIPVSGKIILVFSSFIFPSALDYSDIDLIVNDTNLPLSINAGSGAGSPIGVTVSNTSNAIIFTLNNSDAIGADSAIIIKVGANAIYGGIGDQQISNPATVGSYKIHLETQNSGGVILDAADAMVAIISSIAVGASRVSPPPPISPPAAPVGGGGGGGETFFALFVRPISSIITIPPAVSVVVTTTPVLIEPIEPIKEQSLAFSTTSTVQIFNFPSTTTYKMGEKLVFSYRFKNINKKPLYIIINRQLVNAKGKIVRSISAQKNLKSGKSYLVNVKETLTKTLPAGDYSVRIKIVGPKNKILGINSFVIKINPPSLKPPVSKKKIK